MNRLLQLTLGLYAPHLVEEYLTRMYDDPIIVAAFSPLSQLAPRQATYLVFQVMLALMLGMTILFNLGGRWRSAVMVGLAVALLSESHHLIRWLVTREYNSGLLTSLPMPVLGAVILRSVSRQTSVTSSLQGELA
jgi:hypothetical protein